MWQWILAFDAGCPACRDIASKVQQEAGNRITVRSLRDPDVRQHRVRALGPDAPWLPTLLELAGSEPRAWTGWAMSARLTWRLGPGRALRVARAILREVVQEPGRRTLPERAPWIAAGVFLLTGGVAFADILSRAAGKGTATVRTKRGISPEDLTISPNAEDAAQVLETSLASAKAQELLAYLRSYGVAVGDRGAQKVTFRINRQDPASDPVFDMVRADLSMDGKAVGGYCHVMGPQGEIVLSIVSHPDGTMEAAHNDVGQFAHTVLGQGGRVLSATPPASDTVANPYVLDCFPLCDTIVGAGPNPTIPECLTSCLTVTAISRWAWLTHSAVG